MLLLFFDFNMDILFTCVTFGAILAAVYDRLPPKFIEEKEELGFFLRISEGFTPGA